MDSFASILMDTFPEIDQELALKLRQIVTEVQKTNKPGKLSLAIDIVPNGEDRVLLKVPTISEKLPQPVRGSGMFYVQPGGHLSRQAPHQIALEGMERARK